MKPSDYKFKIDDEVITTYGEVGHITEICTCSSCTERGFHEPVWVDKDGDEHFITIFDAIAGFNLFYKIGDYRFNNVFEKDEILKQIKHHEEVLARDKECLRVIERLERGEKKCQ